MFLFRDVTWYKYLVRFSNTFLKCHYGFNDFFFHEMPQVHSTQWFNTTYNFVILFKVHLYNKNLALVTLLSICVATINCLSCSRNSNSFFFCHWNLDSFPDNSFIKMSYCKLTTQSISLILSVYQKRMQTTVILIKQAYFGVT